MIGRNTLSLNQATMRAALAMYLNSERVPGAPRLAVENVEADDKFAGTFSVNVSTPTEEPSK